MASLSETKFSRFAALGACAALMAACSGGGAASDAKGGGDPELQETLAEPAPAGETALDVEVLADGLVNPWSIAFLPDGALLVAEREGRLRLIRDGALLPEPVAGAPEVLVWNQGGLFDILLHPDFEENGVLYLSYAHGTRDANGTRIARAVFDGSSLSDLEVLYDAKPPKDTGHHFGARMVWGGDGKLYMTIGEGSKYKEKAQDMSTSYGAVIRLNEDGSIPEDNPTFGDGERPELFTKGHRNAQGFAYDAERGVLWEHEHGARGGDEINIIEAGNNYGWPLATYGIDYNGAKITPFTEYEGTTQPVKYWTPSIGPSGLAVYRGDLFPAWNGDLLVGAMAGRALHRVIMEGEEPAGEERYLLDRGERVRDVAVGPDGAIYLATEQSNTGAEKAGKILRLTPQ
ncbi:PQQ-dependent sugar dehydrogenase [Hyphococcus luteus]|uniref:Glucose dehydrogenase n=1 Tax=Hyphococcus luteus TaxID=2058213 RepID=A0A2S7K7H6_9PROT|nr:PQQ-dependent sugar dehydrogenase [Marinicaulis flavus]PQA88443.1 glucose dehydrogenase [Marinicaulis flavus]